MSTETNTHVPAGKTPVPRDRPEDNRPILRTSGLRKRFGEFVAVDDVDMTVEQGEFRSVIGPNGAGKTTLFNLLSGAIPVTAGAVYFRGEDVSRLSPPERVRRGIGRSFQVSNVFGGLTVRENVRLAVQARMGDEYGVFEALFKPTDRYERIGETTDRVLERVGLDAVAERPADALAYGNRRRLEIGVVLATDPELVMLDEPTAGMSAEETRATIELIEDVLADRTLLLIEHNLEAVMDLSDRITVLHRGEVIAEGSPTTVAADESVQEAYLGAVVE